MENQKEKIIQLSGEEYMRLVEIAKSFIEKGVASDAPEFVMLTGGVASGKTTVRSQSFSKEHVNVDYWDFYLAVEKEFGEGNPKLIGFASLLGEMVLRESIEARKNIVIEMIGADKDLFESVMNSMKKIGYKINITLIVCDPVQAYERHLKAVETDRDYQSAYYTERPTLSYFYRYFKLGNLPEDKGKEKLKNAVVEALEEAKDSEMH